MTRSRITQTLGNQSSWGKVLHELYSKCQTVPLGFGAFLPSFSPKPGQWNCISPTPIASVAWVSQLVLKGIGIIAAAG